MSSFLLACEMLMSECAIQEQEDDWRMEGRRDGARQASVAPKNRIMEGKPPSQPSSSWTCDTPILLIVVQLPLSVLVLALSCNLSIPQPYRQHHELLRYHPGHRPSKQRPVHLPRVRVQMVNSPLRLSRLDPTRKRRSRRTCPRRRCA